VKYDCHWLTVSSYLAAGRDEDRSVTRAYRVEMCRDRTNRGREEWCPAGQAERVNLPITNINIPYRVPSNDRGAGNETGTMPSSREGWVGTEVHLQRDKTIVAGNYQVRGGVRQAAVRPMAAIAHLGRVELSSDSTQVGCVKHVANPFFAYLKEVV